MAKWEEGQRKSVLKKSSKFIDMTGVVSGLLTVLKLHGSSFELGSLWECSCLCGGSIIVSTRQLRTGHNGYSCGCAKRPRKKKTIKTHGKCKTEEFSIWKAMRMRCQNQNNSAFSYYGGRGIKVCDKWQKFENFFEDMGLRPSKLHTIDRINVNGNYEPSNCRWATPAQQNSNKRSNHYLHIGGVRLTVNQASRIFNVPWHRIRQRSVSGWPPRAAIFAVKNTRNFSAYE